MSAQFAATQIKLEGVDQAESVTEIQSYLEGFQKEIASTDGPIQQVTGNNIIISFQIVRRFFLLNLLSRYQFVYILLVLFCRNRRWARE